MGYSQRRGTKWRGFYRDGSGRLRSKTFEKEREADDWWKAAETDLNRGVWIDPDAGKVSFRDYAEQWRLQQVHRATTAAQIETHLRRHVYPRIGQRSLNTLRHSDMQALVKALSSHLAPATVHVVMAWVGSILKVAVLDQVIPRSPTVGVRLPSIVKPLAQPLPPETVRTLIATMTPRYRGILILALGTGVRLAEALGLTLDRIDFDLQTVVIDRQLLRGGGPVPQFGPVKDREGRPRTIPVATNTLDALREHIDNYGLGPEGLIFTNDRGGPVGQSTFNDHFRAAADPLGVPVGQALHRFRHTYASHLIQAGLSVKVVQERLGHKSASMTLDVYGHLFPDDDDSTRSAMQKITELALAPPAENVILLRKRPPA